MVMNMTAMKTAILDQLVNRIRDVFENDIERIVLYGSAARGEEQKDSDIDVAIILYSELDDAAEDRLSDIIVDLNLEHDCVLSVVDIPYDRFRKWQEIVPFYRNITNEGIILWKAA